MFVDKDPPRNRVITPSPGVLGTLFRDVVTTIRKEDIFRFEYKYKILKEYRLPADI